MSVAVPAPSSRKGRSLRSGRTLLGEPGGVSDEETDTPGEESSEESLGRGGDGGGAWGWGGDGEEDEDSYGSTASSDISDWTAEAGINFSTPHLKRAKRRRRLEFISHSGVTTQRTKAVWHLIKTIKGLLVSPIVIPRREDNLSTMDKSAGPNVSFIQSFHSNIIHAKWILLVVFSSFFRSSGSVSVLTNDDLQDEDGGELFQSGDERSRRGSTTEKEKGKGKKTIKKPSSVSGSGVGWGSQIACGCGLNDQHRS